MTAFEFDFDFNLEEQPDWMHRIIQTRDSLFYENLSGDLLDRIESIFDDLKYKTYAYIEEGLIYKAFQVFKLYKKFKCNTFKDFCVRVIKKKAWWVQRIIKAAEVGMYLASRCFQELPANPSQAYALYEPMKKDKSYYKDAYDLEKTWKQILDKTEKEQTNITTKIIEEVTNPDQQKSASIKVSKSLSEKLKQKAKELGVTQKDLIEKIFDDYFEGEGTTEVTPEEYARWTEDFQSMTSEYNQHNDETETQAAISQIGGEMGEAECITIPEISGATGLSEEPLLQSYLNSMPHNFVLFDERLNYSHNST
ncbi:MAG: hypothetical protein WBA93_21090 [Microcoleaceae cyanobacterium]